MLGAIFIVCVEDNTIGIFFTYFVYELAFSVTPDVAAVVFLSHLNVVRLHNESSIHVNYAAVVYGLSFSPKKEATKVDFKHSNKKNSINTYNDHDIITNNCSSKLREETNIA